MKSTVTAFDADDRFVIHEKVDRALRRSMLKYGGEAAFVFPIARGAAEPPIVSELMETSMNDNLTSYLNDHLAGSVAAIELIDDLIGASKDEFLKQFFAELKREIESDQKVLERLIDNADENESVTRKAAAWFSEKLARAKFKIAGEDLGGLGLVQALEMLALGIRGKELLWRALSQSSRAAPADVDFADLQPRAVEQQRRVEEKRLEAARAAFGSKAL